MTLESLPFILLQGALFGTTLLASRFSIHQFHPLDYLGLRMFMASLGHLSLYLFGGSRRRPWPRNPKLWQHAVVLGIFGTAIPMGGIVSSLEYQSSGVTSSLIALGPAFTLMLAHFTLSDESLSKRKGIGVAVALCGGLVLALRGETGLTGVARASPVGYLLALGGILSSSVMTVYARRFMRGLDVIDVASVRMFTATVVTLPLAAALSGLDLSNVERSGYAALGYAALMGTFAGMLVSFYNIKRFGATTSALTVYVIPVVANLGGALFLGERITLGMLAGMICIALGLVAIHDFNQNRYQVDSV